MTSGWSGNNYSGIPAGVVGTVDTMQPAPPSKGTYPPAMVPGLSYYMMRGQEGLYGAYTQDAVYQPTGLVPEGCASSLSPQCGVPPMAYCRTLQCARGYAPFPSGCVAPSG